MFERKMGVKFIWGEARDPGISDDFRTKDLSMSGKKKGCWAIFVAISARNLAMVQHH